MLFRLSVAPRPTHRTLPVSQGKSGRLSYRVTCLVCAIHTVSLSESACGPNTSYWTTPLVISFTSSILGSLIAWTVRDRRLWLECHGCILTWPNLDHPLHIWVALGWQGPKLEHGSMVPCMCLYTIPTSYLQRIRYICIYPWTYTYLEGTSGLDIFNIAWPSYSPGVP